MKKRFLTSTLAVVAGIGMMASSASAYFYNPGDFTEYETVFPTDAVSTSAMLPAAGSGDGIYIWADDATLTTWNIAWTGGGQGNGVNYSGEISLLNAEGTFANFGWTGVDNLEVYSNGVLQNGDVQVGQTVYGDRGEFSAKAAGGYDQISVTFDNWVAPSYIALDLGIGVQSATYVAEHTFIGGDFTESLASLQSAPDDDFKMYAPIPEPTTMLLFGVGLAGLAGVARRRRK